MSDIEFNDAVTKIIADSAAAIGAANTTAPAVDVSEDKADKKTTGGWVNTRQCACPDDAPTDCRFHSQSEPGWEVCPHLKGVDPSTVKSRWLYVNTSPQLIDDDPTEAQDAALEAKLAVR